MARKPAAPRSIAAPVACTGWGSAAANATETSASATVPPTSAAVGRRSARRPPTVMPATAPAPYSANTIGTVEGAMCETSWSIAPR